jgi:hypothetical protein
MRKLVVLLFVLAFLPTLCLAGSIDDVTTYQINITATWIETNPACVSNCTENMDLSYRYESNLDVFNPNSPNAGIFGWVEMNTIQESSSGFLGSFFDNVSNLPPNTLWTDYGRHFGDGMPFVNSLDDEIDLGNQGPGLSNSGPPLMYIYSCTYDQSCRDAYPGVFTQYVMANRETSTAVQVPAFDSAWELLLISAIACTFGFFVKHRLDLAPSS